VRGRTCDRHDDAAVENQPRPHRERGSKQHGDGGIQRTRYARQAIKLRDPADLANCWTAKRCSPQRGITGDDLTIAAPPRVAGVEIECDWTKVVTRDEEQTGVRRIRAGAERQRAGRELDGGQNGESTQHWGGVGHTPLHANRRVADTERVSVRQPDGGSVNVQLDVGSEANLRHDRRAGTVGAVPEAIELAARFDFNPPRRYRSCVGRYGRPLWLGRVRIHTLSEGDDRTGATRPQRECSGRSPIEHARSYR